MKQRAILALLAGDGFDESLLRAGAALDPKNERGFLGRMIGQAARVVKAETQLPVICELFDTLDALGPIRDRQLAAEVYFLAAYWNHNFLNQTEKAKRYAEKAKPLYSGDARRLSALDQISTALATRTGLSAIHLFTHGEAGVIDFGSERLSLDNIAQQREALSAWSDSLADNADLLIRDDNGRDLRRLELEASSGVNTFTWDLLLDETQALAAEQASLEDDAEAEDGDTEDGDTENDDADDEASTLGERAKTPWAEAVRLGRPLYITPGTYTLTARTGDGEAETELEVKPPEPREPRMKKEPKIRGQKDD